MRSAIFIAGMLIADAINHQGAPTDSVTSFCAILFLVFALVDLLEFFHKISRK